MVQNCSVADLPDDTESLARLARRLGYEAADPAAAVAAFRSDMARHAARTRALFQAVVATAASAAAAPTEAPRS